LGNFERIYEFVLNISGGIASGISKEQEISVPRGILTQPKKEKP
jgi:hypothetical protein